MAISEECNESAEVSRTNPRAQDPAYPLLARCFARQKRSQFGVRAAASLPRLRGLAVLLLTCGTWLYLLLVIAVAGLIWVGGDRWWYATLILFGPRWIYGVPLLLLFPLALPLKRRLWKPLAVAAVVVIWPILGFCIPFGALAPAGGPSVRVLTCNIGGPDFSATALAELISQDDPDIIALQECYRDDVLRVLDGYKVLRDGELIIASRWGMAKEQTVGGIQPAYWWPRTDLLVCRLETPYGPLSFACVHLPSPRAGLLAVLDRRTLLRPSQSDALITETALRRQRAEAAAAAVDKLDGPVLLAGDFNLPVESAIYRDCWSRFTNAFSRVGLGRSGTMQAGVRGLRFGIRLDHVLCDDALRPRRCWVGSDVGSEHLPVLADVVLLEKP